MFVVKTKNFIILFSIIFLEIFTEGHPRIPLPNEQRWLSTDEYHGRSHMIGERPEQQQRDKIFRLPDNLKPIFYDLKLVPYLEGNFTFSGQVNITLLVTRSTKNILMHSRDLNITALEVYRGTQKIACNFTLLPKDEILSIQSQTTFYRRFFVEVRIKFKGSLNDQALGFYRGNYMVGNTTKWLASTQFEETYARWAFPCFDEPKFRATFRITIARYPHQQVISNMPLKSTSKFDPSINNRVWDLFETTPPMPTYLVAFVISELKYRTDTEQNIRLWATENVLDDTAYALKQGSALKKVLEKFLQVPYSLPKLDVAAIPTFKWGGMENWGLITFRESHLLWNEKFYSESKKSLITILVAHEFSHMWFGDLVTIAWWDYLWLKEGFATYFQYFATALKETSWRFDELFVVEELHFSLRYDGFGGDSPMTAKIRSNLDVNWQFFFASYHKAASVIRMMEHVVSPVTFKNALNLFLVSRKNAGGVADPSHLYDAFEKQLQKEHKPLPKGINVTSVFKKFSEQVGYPCVTVSRIANRNGRKIDIEIKQEPYTTKSSKKPERTWFVPLSCTKQSELNFNRTEPTMWLTNASKIILSNEVGDDEWYLCNIKQTGYYRVNYDLKNWQLLINQLHSSPTKIHPLNRAQLIEDCYTFVDHGYLPLSVLFDLLGYLELEVDPIPWLTSLNKLFDWSQQFENTMVSSELKHFAKHVIESYYNHVGFHEKPTDCHLTKIMRTSLTFIASTLEVKDAVTKANAEFNGKTDLRNISLSVRDAVLCTAIRTNPNMTVWNRLWDIFRKADDELEKPLVLRSFGCASTEDLLKKFIFKLVNASDHDIPENLKGSVYCSVQHFQRGITASLNFILDMIPQLGNQTKAYDVVMRLLRHMDDRIQSNEQIHLLDRVIEESKKLDQRKYGDIAIVSNVVKEKGLKKIKQNNEIAEKMFAVLGKEETTTTSPGTKTTSSSVPGPSTTSKPAPSLASYFTPSVISLLLPYLFVTATYW